MSIQTKTILTNIRTTKNGLQLLLISLTSEKVFQEGLSKPNIENLKDLESLINQTKKEIEKNTETGSIPF